MTKTATAKKTSKTMPMSNCTNSALALDNPNMRPLMQAGPDVAQATSHHNEKAPSSSQPAAATKPHTRGDLRTSKTVPMPSVQAPSLSSHRSHLNSRCNQARDPNPSRDDPAVTHPLPFEFLPQRTGNEASAAGHSAPHPRTPEIQVV